ncbi:methylenetetrahydrofolate reductase C-terminal domain-containing protein [Candidatus Acetothermia bacterium]|jgi:ferredoxin|nr:methylenetetrahydrofolate reductase C-terminal domain-containing protein [Candidatus Acetothermia bacterium]MCI2432436.1 methylenetetrahydrofolate reductase C-terminal domain-containing protein [Candidatus Acetothermia bacterium]MCI2436307.1 methylenetetrahydrofolate reductase C-terminal domain-containing protein [Candidatus Acetothermia bacterium]
MIVADQKPIEEILEILAPYKRVLFLGCQSCVAVCMAGGEKEVGLLAAAVRLARAKSGAPIEIAEGAAKRQCDDEFNEPFGPVIQQQEAVLSLACGVGVNKLAERFAIPILPALNTRFFGKVERQGIWKEVCAGCGDCILHLTGGICPIARCAKNLLNGPCGGVRADGTCEVKRDWPCAWVQIIQRLEELGQLERLLSTRMAAKDWSSDRHGGPRRRVREDMLLEA